MKKDAYYFPHYCNARHDRKIKRAMKDLGCEAYGIYFMLLEVLRDQQGFKYPIKDLDLLEIEFGTSLAKIQAVVKGYDLFQVDEESNFFSLKFNFYLQPYLEKSERARTAANIRWEQVKQIESKCNANAMQMQCAGNASKVKESKVKESKEEKINKKELPTSDEVRSLFVGYLSNLNITDLNEERADGQIRSFIRFYIGDEDTPGKWIKQRTKFNVKTCIKNWIDKNPSIYRNHKSVESDCPKSWQELLSRVKPATYNYLQHQSQIGRLENKTLQEIWNIAKAKDGNISA